MRRRGRVGAQRQDSVTLKRPGKISLFSYNPRQPVPEEAEPEELAASLPDAPPADEDEAALVERARTEPTAFGQLYERYVDRVYSYILYRVGNVQDAEDLTARTFYRALDKLNTYEDRGLPFSAWLFRIAHNLVANWHRDRSKRRFLPIEKLWWQSEDRVTPQEQVEQEEVRRDLWDAINRLPEERRNLLLYKVNTTLSNLEIGEMMNKSESAIKSLYFRTLAALRRDLEEHGWDEESAEPAAPNQPAGASMPDGEE